MEEEKKSKKIIILSLIGIFVVISGVLFFLFKNKDENILADRNEPNEENDNYIANTSDIIFTNVGESIHLKDVVPTLDKFGVLNDSFSFSIRNNSFKDVHYSLKMIDNNSTILNKMIRYQITKNSEVIGISTLSDDGVIDIGIIKSNEEIAYSIKIWLNYESDVKVGSFNKKISVEEIDDVTSNVYVPELINGMIPVYYDYDLALFRKSDINNDSYYNKWYDYENGIWANVVTVNSEKRKEYEKSPVGTPISLSDINSMWVWIPRFNYNVQNNQYDIYFTDTNTQVSNAFKFDNKDLKGYWVSKFELGISEDSECFTSLITSKCNHSNNTLLLKPNVPLMNKVSMANIFYSIRKMELKGNIYGFSCDGKMVKNDGTIINDNNNYDIHMIRNSEWDMLGVLSKSKYGNKNISTNNYSYTGMYEINDEKYLFDVKTYGESGSINGNVTGVYDMVGGKCEFVMLDINNLFNKKSNSGFTSKVLSKYYDTKDDLDTRLDYEIKEDIVSRGGYKKLDNQIFNTCSISDYVDKVSLMTGSRAVISVFKED